MVSDKNGIVYLNTEVWNNPRIVGITGYSIEMLKEPLYLLALFIQQNLSPNRLEGFDIEGIKSVKDISPQIIGGQFIIQDDQNCQA